MTAVIMGSAETTFYVLAVYLGAVSIRKTRYLVPVCLVSDFVGIVVAVAVVRWIF
jgi:spore maturation protein B